MLRCKLENCTAFPPGPRRCWVVRPRSDEDRFGTASGPAHGSARGTAAAGRPWYPWGYAARVTAGRMNPLLDRQGLIDPVPYRPFLNEQHARAKEVSAIPMRCLNFLP